MNDLRNRTALVTGASSGIGRAIAVALAKAGASVCLTGRNEKRLSAAAAECGGADVAVQAVDLTKRAAVDRLVDFVADRFGGLDILVHSAGIITFGKTADAALSNLSRQIEANVSAPYALTQALLPALVERGGDIVFVNSSITRHPRAGAAQFAMTQFAMTGFADSLREEVNEQGVRVLSVFSGRTATPRQEEIFRRENRDYEPARLLQPEDVAATVRHALSLPRTAEITEIHIRPMIKA